MTNYLSLVDSGRFEELFEELGWGFVPRGVQPVTVDFEGGKSLTANPVADQSGLRVWVVESNKLPSPTEQRLVDAAVNKVSQVRLIIFTDGKNQSWRWPRRGATAATNTKLLHHHYEVGNEELGMDLARRLQMIELPIGEKIGILEIQERMAKAFNDEAVKRSHDASGHMRVMNEQLLDAGCTTDASSSLLVRLLFLFFGDDTNMWPDDTFQKWVLHHTTAENIHEKLTELFAVLCDPELDKALGNKGKYATTEYRNFRRIDGMYKERIELPPLTEDFRQQVLKACDFDWGKVNPDIFGAMFQQLVDLEELRKNGEHYTSEENIMKVIEPLFLDEYRAKFEEVYNDRNKLLELQDELATLKFLDPACGCGNFLIQAYKHLRGLEYEIIVRAEELEVAEINAELDAKEHQRDSERKRALRQRLQEIESGGFINFGEGVLRKSKLSMRQFHGIEINEWPAKVASTAMLLVDHLCNQVWGQSVVRLPIEQTPEIRCTNALRVDWNEIVTGTDRVLVFGNPPFIGQDTRSKEQLADLQEVWGRKNISRLDFVTAWHVKATQFLTDRPGEFAYVTTNSIAQGEQVPLLFGFLRQLNWQIKFAVKTFPWDSEASSKAAVHCVIVGFTRDSDFVPRLWEYSRSSNDTIEIPVKTGINPYLVDAHWTIVDKAPQPISPEIEFSALGAMPKDGGGLILTENERDEALADPIAKKYVLPYYGARELLNGKHRWCLWLVDAPKTDLDESRFLAKRLEMVKTFRLESKAPSTKALASTPHLFAQTWRQEVPFLCIPRVSSENRRYFPVARFSPNVIASDAAFTLADPTGLQFALISSAMFLEWQKMIGGRLKSDMRFGSTLTWHTFPVPALRDEEREHIIGAGDKVRAVRDQLKGRSLAEMYSPGKEDQKLLAAHEQLDAAVDSVFRMNNVTARDRQSALFNAYEELSKL